MAYTPTPEFIAALEQIDALIADTNTPAPVTSLATATKSGMMELAAKQQMLQTLVEQQEQQLSAAASSTQLSAASAKQEKPPQQGELIEAAPPALHHSIPPGMYEAPRGEAAASGTPQTHVISGYEPFRGEPEQQK